MVVNAIVVVARRVVDLSSLAPSKSEVYHFGFFPRQCFSPPTDYRSKTAILLRNNLRRTGMELSTAWNLLSPFGIG